MPKNQIIVNRTEILKHAVTLGYDWNIICNSTSFKAVLPQDGEVLAYIENDNYGQNKFGESTTWLEDFTDMRLKEIIESFMKKFDLLHVEWCLK